MCNQRLQKAIIESTYTTIKVIRYESIGVIIIEEE